jgi:hypothetical protein
MDNPCPAWPLLVDTGADLTVIPTTATAFLNIKVARAPQANIKFVTQQVALSCPWVYVKIAHPDFGCIGPIRAACMDRSSILLGRDCLAMA